MVLKRKYYLIPCIAVIAVIIPVLSCISVQQVHGNKTADYKKYEITESRNAAGVAVIVHGLNLKPDKMSDLVNLFQTMNYDTINVVLMGHDGNIDDFAAVTEQDWLDDIAGALSIAEQLCEEDNLPVVFTGFSLGALTGLCYQEFSGSALFDKTILFAPAIEIKFPEWLARLLFILKDSILIKSSQNSEYRVFPGSSISAYKALISMLDRFHKDHQVFDGNSALIIIDKNDEAVSRNRIISNYNMENKKVVILERNKRDMEIKNHHLVIDRKSLGDELWKTAVSEISEYLEKTPNAKK